MSEFLTPIIKEFSEVIYPLKKGIQSPEDFELLLLHYGWDVQLDEQLFTVLNSTLGVVALVDSLDDLVDTFTNDVTVEVAQAAIDLVLELKNTTQQLSQLSDSAIGLPAPLNNGTFWVEFSENIFNDLLATYLKRNQAFLYGLFHFFGIIRYEDQTPVGADRIAFTRTVIEWDELGNFLSDPFDQFNQNYNWDIPNNDFDHTLLLSRIERILHAFKLPAIVGLPRKKLADRLLDTSKIEDQKIRELYLPLVD
ncbi:MAG: hypothetical protein AAGI23_06500 [Bacteroidota bacterium]